MDDDSRGEGNQRIDNANKTSSNRKRKRLLQAEWEEAVDMSLTRTGHTASTAVMSTSRNAGVVVTYLPNLMLGECPF
jgi:hypothetical protein